MKARAFLLSLTLVCVAGGAVAATSMLGQGAQFDIAETKATPSAHELTITSFAYTQTWEDNGAPNYSNYLVANLEEEGNYFAFHQTFNGATFGGGHLYTGSYYNSGSNFFIMLSQRTVSDMKLYSANDGAAEHKINLYGFDNFVSMEIYMGEGNQVRLGAGDKDIVCTPDSVENPTKYTFTGKLDSFAYYSPAFPDAVAGNKLVINRITINYNC